ncbi:MAG: YbbR-like domain-containing protein [Gemmatimonadales bacterium]
MTLAGVLFRNWPLKVGALALSTILWVYVAAEQPTSKFIDVVVELDLPPELALARPAPQVRAAVTGPWREVTKLYDSPLTVHLAVPASAGPPRWQAVLVPSDIQVPHEARVTIQDVEPRGLELEIDRVVRRDVPVAVRATVEPESGFALAGPVAVTPATVRISGPRALVQTVDSFLTEAVEIRGVTGAFERVVPLDTTGHALLRVSPREVTVSGRARKS